MAFWDKFKFKPKPFKDQEIDAKSAVAPKVREGKGVKAKEHHSVAAAEASHFLVRPHLSEKAVGGSEHENGCYVFVVPAHANKIEIKKAVEAVYGVIPTAVRIVSVRGKSVRFGHTLGTTRGWKKALVTLPQGKKIDVYA